MAEKDKLKLSKTSHLSKILANAKKNIKTGAKEVGGFLLSEADKYIGEPYRATKRVGDVITGKRKKSEIGPMDVVEALSMGLGSGVPFAPKGANVAGITKKVALRQAKGDPDDYYIQNLPKRPRKMLENALQGAVDIVPSKNWEPIKRLHVGISRGNQKVLGGYYEDGTVTINPFNVRRHYPTAFPSHLKKTLFHEMSHARQYNPQDAVINIRGKKLSEPFAAMQLRTDSSIIQNRKFANSSLNDRLAYLMDPTEVHSNLVADRVLRDKGMFNKIYEQKLQDVGNRYKYSTLKQPDIKGMHKLAADLDDAFANRIHGEGGYDSTDFVNDLIRGLNR